MPGWHVGKNVRTEDRTRINLVNYTPAMGHPSTQASSGTSAPSALQRQSWWTSTWQLGASGKADERAARALLLSGYWRLEGEACAHHYFEQQAAIDADYDKIARQAKEVHVASKLPIVH